MESKEEQIGGVFIATSTDYDLRIKYTGWKIYITSERFLSSEELHDIKHCGYNDPHIR